MMSQHYQQIASSDQIIQNLESKMTARAYKICAVPQCVSTSIRTRDKLFIHVPQSPDLRKKWLQLALRDFGNLLPKYTMYFCEDHFDLMNDMENYMEFKIMGYVGKIRMKPNCLPTKFACQPDRRIGTASSMSRLEIAKKHEETINKKSEMANKEIEETAAPILNGASCHLAGAITKFKTEIADDYPCTPNEDVPIVIKSEFPLNMDDDLIKIEETTLQSTEDPIVNNEIYFCDVSPTTTGDEMSLCAENSMAIKPDSTTSLIKLEYPLTPEDHLMAIEEITLQPKIEDIDDTYINSCDVSHVVLKTEDSLKNPCTLPLDWCSVSASASDTTRTTKGIYQCDICGEENILTGNQPSPCDVCANKVAVENELGAHMRDMPYECDVCEKKFSRKFNLTKHKRTHTGDRPYECELCQKKFSRTDLLVKHKRIHSDDRPYTCDLCEKKFSQKDSFNLHWRTHTGDRPYQCNMCEKRFSQKINLITHKQTHTGDRPFKCATCERKFSRSDMLMRHMRIHTGDRPYECDLCDRKFSQRTSLNLHRRAHLGDQPDK